VHLKRLRDFICRCRSLDSQNLSEKTVKLRIILHHFAILFFFAWKILDILAAGLNSLLRRASQ